MNNFIITDDLKLIKLDTTYDPSDFDYDKDPTKGGSQKENLDSPEEEVEADWDDDSDWDDDGADSDSEY